jgi:hypothetical protein
VRDVGILETEILGPGKLTENSCGCSEEPLSPGQMLPQLRLRKSGNWFCNQQSRAFL